MPISGNASPSDRKNSGEHSDEESRNGAVPAVPMVFAVGGVIREFPHSLDVIRTFARLRELPYSMLLDSATATISPSGSGSPTARYSFAMADPDMVIQAKGRTIQQIDRRLGTTIVKEGRALDIVREILDAEQDAVTKLSRVVSQEGLREELREGLREDTERNTARSIPRNTPPDLPPFQGGFAGYIGYEYGGVLERLPTPRLDDVAIPDVVLGRYPWVIAWDHWVGRSWIMGPSAEVERIYALVHEGSEEGSEHTLLSPEQPSEVHALVTRSEYEAAIERIQEYIRAGDIFQTNLSQRFSTPLTQSPWDLYQQLRALNPAPFAAYFDFGEAVIVSASPERFLHVTPSGQVETRPIKGTRPRGATPTEDTLNSSELLQSEKDAAEHIMIVDVLRNDIARVCEYGSVRVPELKRLESHATVHHLVSTITGQLRPAATAIDCLHACFPGGSITGAPKVRAMEIIAELEPTARNVYCGSIGYFSTTGAMDSSIVIRTFTIKDQIAYFSAGGGIVADSIPASEYQETLDKTHALVQALERRP